MLCVGVTLSQTHTSTVCLWYSRKYEVHNYCSSWWIDDPLRLISTHGVLLKESHLEPFQSSCRSQDQLYKQLYASIKCTAQSCHCHSQEETPTITCCWENTWSGWSKVNQKPPSDRSLCWKTAVSVHSQVCFTPTWAERLLCWKKLFLQTQHL